MSAEVAYHSTLYFPGESEFTGTCISALFPMRRAFPELTPARRHWWLVVDKLGEVELCLVDPGSEVDLCVTTDLRTLTAIWMGRTTVKKSAAGMSIVGDTRVARHMQAWLGLSPFAARTA